MLLCGHVTNLHDWHKGDDFVIKFEDGDRLAAHYGDNRLDFGLIVDRDAARKDDEGIRGRLTRTPSQMLNRRQLIVD